MSTFPPDEALDVPQNTQIYVILSKEIDKKTVYNDTIVVQQILKKETEEEVLNEEDNKEEEKNKEKSKENKDNKEEKKGMSKEKLGEPIAGKVHRVETENKTYNALLFLTNRPLPEAAEFQITVDDDKRIKSVSSNENEESMKLVGKKKFKFTTDKLPVEEENPQINGEKSEIPEEYNETEENKNKPGTWDPYEPIRIVFDRFIFPEKLDVRIEYEQRLKDDNREWKSLGAKIFMIDSLKLQKKVEESDRFKEIWFRKLSGFSKNEKYQVAIDYNDIEVLSSHIFKTKTESDFKDQSFPEGFLDGSKKQIVIEPTPFKSSSTKWGEEE